MSVSSRVTPVPPEQIGIRRAFKLGETAWLLGLTYDNVLKLVRDGEIRTRPVGKYHLVPSTEIDRFLAPAKGAA